MISKFSEFLIQIKGFTVREVSEQLAKELNPSKLHLESQREQDFVPENLRQHL